MPYGAVIIRYDGLYHAQIHVKGNVWYFGYESDGYDYEKLRKIVNTKVHVNLPNKNDLKFWDMMGDEICVLDRSKNKRKKFINRDEYFKGWKPVF